jgi:AmmeMemoRadiSam system protein B
MDLPERSPGLGGETGLSQPTRTGEILPFELLEALVKQLNENHYLDSSHFRSFVEKLTDSFLGGATRPARHAGNAYEGSSEALRRQIDGFFTDPEGPGRTSKPESTTPVRGLIAPHIDFLRGGPTYAHAYKALSEHPGADRFIVFGTCHTPMKQRFALTRKHFESPLGIAETDVGMVERLAEKSKKDYFIDEFSHRGEHSIEFQAVFLRYVVQRDFKIVPILVSSFEDRYQSGKSPAEDEDIADMVWAVQEVLRENPTRYCVVAGADLAHVGPQFGDPSGPTDQTLYEVERQDREFLEYVASGDAEGSFQAIAADQDRRRVCGCPPIYLTLRCLERPRGELLQYRQWKDVNAGAAVTYAGLALF